MVSGILRSLPLNYFAGFSKSQVQFSLKGRLDDPEYLIGGPAFHAMLRDRGFVQHTWMNMAEYLDVEIKKPEVYAKWMAQSRGESCKKSDWDVVSLYTCGIFRKT